MKKSIMIIAALMIVVLLLICNFAYAGQWRFPVGVAYSTGFYKMTNVVEDNLHAMGYSVEKKSQWPVGLTFQPYYEFDNGLGIGGGFGPFMYLKAESPSESYSLYAMPVNLSLRYAFLPSSNISPYIRSGISYHIAGGDFVKSKEVGFLVGIGTEFFRKKKVGFGFEFAVDTSSVNMTKYYNSDKKVRPSEFLISIFAVF
ncbi:MAG: outer membrane beta-barrel protein [Nitrospirota bacterium]